MSRSPRSVVTFPIVLRELTVLRVRDVTPGMRRITLGGEQLRAFETHGLELPPLRSDGFDDHVKFFFAEGDDAPVLPRQNVSSLDWPADARPIAKDYTPVRFDPEAGEIDFDFVRHEGGIASAWAEAVEPGEITWIAGPKMSHSHPEGVDWLLVIGDETALPAIGRWLAEMPAGTRARVLIEVGEDSHRQDLPTEADAEITWLSRQGAPAGTTTVLEDALRGVEWLPGEVFVWAAGEAGALKGIRRHLASERKVPRDRTHITGYWRYTPHAPGVDAAAAEDEEDEAHERLHDLTDLAPAYAIRTAVTLGLVDLVHGGVRDLEELARRSGSNPSVLAALMSYLEAIDVFTTDERGYRLTAISEELVEDDHSAEEYDLRGAQAAFDLSIAGLLDTVRTGAAGYRTLGGQTLAEAMRDDVRLGTSARAAVEEETRWVAPGVSAAYDWSSVTALTAAGDGVGTVVNALAKEFAGLKVRIVDVPSQLKLLEEQILDTDVLARIELVPQSNQVPRGGQTVLVCHLLDRLPDDDAVVVLAETAAGLPAGGELIMVEQVTAADTDDVDATLHHLRLTCAFGSGVRSADQLSELAARAGLTVHSCRDIGWDHRLWVLTAE
ncbi:siderophore-interacting protein [Streptomyces sp. NBC_00690]|uniref:siderophore-interacting protein n=1 Tax=Streptomyces sp. NBC_00690 TaxID=2975808 RepID=UPI002E2C863D|nr:siderophore-interacting protein [Streptomyces sp. NBC_00690]